MALSDPPQSDIPSSPVRRRESAALRAASEFALGVAAARAINGRGPADCRCGSEQKDRQTHPPPYQRDGAAVVGGVGSGRSKKGSSI